MSEPNQPSNPEYPPNFNPNQAYPPSQEYPQGYPPMQPNPFQQQPGYQPTAYQQPYAPSQQAYGPQGYAPGQPVIIQQGPNTGFVCPWCNYSASSPIPVRKISGMGWAVFWILLLTLVLCWLCWLGLLMKVDSRICPQCHRKV